MTRIQLIGVINGYLDIAEDVNVPLNFGISDIRDLTKKSGALSKSIRVAGTKENSILLNQLFDVNIVDDSATFNVNRKQAVVLWQDRDVVMDNAVMQLVSVDVVSVGSEESQRFEYIVLLKDTVGDFFTDLGNAELTDLDFSDFNHVYSSSNVVASFVHDWQDGYKYTLPYTPSADYFLQEMKPAVYGLQLWNRIFARAGKSYQWDDLQDEQFDKVLHPYSGGKVGLTEDYLDEVEVVVTNPSFFEVEAFPNQQNLNVLFPATAIKDLQNYYDDTTFKYNIPFELSAPNNLVYKVEISYNIGIRNTSGIQAFRLPATGDLNLTPLLIIRKDATVPTNIVSGTRFVNVLDTIKPVSIVSQQFPSDTVRFLTSSGTTTDEVFQVGDTIVARCNQTIEIPLPYVPLGENLRVTFSLESDNPADWNLVGGGTDADVYPYLEMVNCVITIQPSAETLGLNFPVLLNDFLPKRVKQAEYIKSVMTMFNLFAIPDEDNDQKLIFMSRDKYYDSGVVKDWTGIKCKELGETITFLPDITSKRLALSYKADTDPFNEAYVDNTSEVYGQIEYTFDNEFVKNDERKEIVFTPAPFVRTSFGALVNAVNGAEPKTGMRAVLDGGMYPCGMFRILDYIQPNGVGVGAVEYNYPLTIHFDKPLNPNYDLNFAICDFYFDAGIGVITNNNLANRHWRRSMAQINSGKLLTAYFKLTSVDIANLKLNDKIFVNGSYWNINKVIDYSANKRIPTKVELISADDELTLPIFPRTIPTNPNKGDATITNPINAVNLVRNRSLNTDLSGGDTIIVGVGNYISPDVKNAIVVGDNQFVDKDGLFIDGKNVGEAVGQVTKIVASQTSTNDPTQDILIDQIGQVSFTRFSTGTYDMAFTTDVFDGISVLCSIANSDNTSILGIGKRTNSIVRVTTRNTSGTLVDGFLDNASIIIEIQ